MYLITTFLFFMLGGLMALVIRAELFEPGVQIVKRAAHFSQPFTLPVTIMLLLCATPLYVGIGNVMVPLQIGAPDVAFPRMNMFAYWIFALGGVMAVSGFLTPK